MRWTISVKDTWRMGRDSGFHVCCVMQFILRNFLCNTLRLWWVQRWWHNRTEQWAHFKEFSHCPCFFHHALAALNLWHPRYGTCLPCDWDQLLRPNYDLCVRCRRTLSPLHVRRYMVVMKNGGQRVVQCRRVKRETTQ